MRPIEIHADGQALIRQARDLYNVALANNGGDPIRDLNGIGFGMFFGFFGGLSVFALGLGIWLHARRWRWCGVLIGLSGVSWSFYALFWPLVTWGG